jgi:chromosome segregation ATPase
LSEGRADGAKIHKHLNAMNKQLLDTNADLAREAEAWRDEVGRLRRILQDASIEVEEVDVMANLTQAGGSFSDLPAELRRRPEGSLGASSGLSKPSSWQDRFDRQLQKSDMIVSQLSQLGVPRGSPGERVDSDEDEHTLAPQEMAQRLRELEAGMDDKDRMIEELHGKLSRGMGSVDREAEGLKQQLEDAERDRVALQEEFALKTQQHAAKFGEICSGFEEQVKDLEARLGSAREECERLRADKSRLEALTAIDSLGAREVEWRRQVAGLETELSRAKDDAKARAAAAASSEKHSVQLREERQELMREAETAKAQLEDVQSRFDAFKGQLEDVKAELDEVKTELAEALAAKETAENDVMQLNQDIGELQLANADQVTELDGQHQQIEELVRALRELEQQVVDSESPKQLADSEELDELRQELEEVAATIADKDAELEALRGKLEVAEMAANQLRRSQTSASPDRTPMRDRHVSVEDQASFVVAIEERLDEAYREIGRLKHELAATPHRKSGIETRDAKIKALEREKAALVERLGAAKAGTISSHTSILQSAGSPFTRPTPFVHRAVASLETLKTPGPLKDVSNRCKQVC